VDKWQCSKCLEYICEKPINKFVKCMVCGEGRYRVVKTCQCGKEFKPDTYSAVSCSRKCAMKYMVRKSTKGTKRPHTQRARIGICKVCGKEFRAVKDFKDRKQIYCSKKCWNVRQENITLNCLNCNKEFKFPKREVKYGRAYCSRKCSNAHMVGEYAGQWKDGKSLERQRGRDSSELASWRISVYVRDKHICQKCGAKENLNAHHIKHYSEYQELRFDIDNGITLCEVCHAKEHKKKPPQRKIKQCAE